MEKLPRSGLVQHHIHAASLSLLDPAEVDEVDSIGASTVTGKQIQPDTSDIRRTS
ncbi:hypothetical protein L1N85_22290 [Paenibacillus alkaliterrae]|uniref:hypothetical protein n=1 Tax=Paenibacillus alkaliterrae TaxID=320909 RepID=UPI001F3D86A5|nr:hypothetical protein [Paenibacillus alkaliterrae]MCF2941107.1 hypothetical protein [Paenibacillus alkaliterrae]